MNDNYFRLLLSGCSLPVSDEMVLSESDGINIESIPSQAAICITKSINGYQIQVNINFTSQRFNADLDGVDAG